MTRRSGPSEGNEPLLRRLLEYAISTYFPEEVAKLEPDVERYRAFYRVGAVALLLLLLLLVLVDGWVGTEGSCVFMQSNPPAIGDG